MKIGILSDIHLGVMPYQLEAKKLDIFQTFSYVVEKILPQFDIIVIAGDLFDKIKIDYETFKIASLLSKFKERIFYIEGNHDKGSSAFYEAIGIPNRKILPINDELVLVGLNWMEDHSVLKEKIKELKKEIYPENTILVLHANIKELMPFLTHPYLYLSFEDLQDFKFCIIGHIHNGGIFQDKFLIPGSIERLDVTNKEERKLYYLTITDEFIRVNYFTIPTRLIIESNDISEIENVIKSEKLPPIVFYTGKVDNITPAKLLYFESKCLLFKTKTKLENVIDEMLNINIQFTRQTLENILLEFYSQFKEINQEIIKIFINNLGDIKKCEEDLKLYIDNFLNKS